MESLWPQLFTFTFFVPAALRIAAAIFYADLAAHLFKHRSEVAAGPFPFVGKPGMGIAWFGVIVCALIALSFATGMWTQAAALLGFSGALKGFIFAKQYPSVYAHSRMAYFLLAVVCLALLVSGAGAFAIDKPY